MKTKEQQVNDAPPSIHTQDYWMRVQDEAMYQLYKAGEVRRLVKNARGEAMVNDKTGTFLYRYINDEY